MNRLLVLSALGLLTACAPALTSQNPADLLLHPGQTWQVVGTAGGQPAEYRIRVRSPTTRQSNGFVGCTDMSALSDPRGGSTVLAIVYDPLDSDSEFNRHFPGQQHRRRFQRVALPGRVAERQSVAHPL
ncbi:hypothetical protein [Deinococcus sonorensis]|uniref:Lipoprotein n=2 Tax=Deinococcus sonorensis TaxID=309891 RepID=A0AAU7UE68_9DEIO